MASVTAVSSVEVVVRQLGAGGERTGLVGDASMSVTDDAILLTPRGQVRVLTLRADELSGLALHEEPGELYLYPIRAPAVVVHPLAEGGEREVAAFLELAASLERAAYSLPELTRALRRVGGHDAALAGDHDRWFGALVTSRRRAARADGWRARLDSLDPDTLARAATDALHAAGVVRFPASPPDQRALEAALEEHAAPLLDALHALRRAATAVRDSDEAHRLEEWRRWVDAARACFVAADRGWGAMAPALRLRLPVPPAPADEMEEGGGA